MGNEQSGLVEAAMTVASAAVNFIPNFISGLIETFRESPQESNDTLLAIEENLKRQDEAHRQQVLKLEEQYRKREVAAARKNSEEAAQAREETAAARKNSEKAAQARKETAAAAARQVEEAVRQREEAVRQREEAAQLYAKQMEEAVRQREEAARKTYEEAAQAREETARQVEEAVRQREGAVRQREDAAQLYAKQMEEAVRQREEAARKTYEDAAQAREETARQVEEAARQRVEAALLNAKLMEEAAQQREEAAMLAAQQLNDAARLREEAALLAAKQIEAAAREREECALAEASKAQEALQRGIRPVVMPTKDEVHAAKKQIKYDTSKLHFAVCGSSGSGKSTVINAVRGLRNKSDGAAGVGVTECTSQITRYPDPRKELPYSRFVWFDIPGAGTIKVPDWQYFNDQGLFVFDFIIMVYDVRFTKIDVGIIENCLRFNIPVFIVRSKADQHILNMIQSETDCEPGDTDFDQVYDEMCTRYVKETRADFYQHMENMANNEELDERDRQLLYSQRVYIISAATLRLFLSEAKADQKKRTASKTIDEVILVEDMLRAAKNRRYPKTK